MTYTGWIIYNGSLAGNKFIDFAQWLQRAATKLNCHTNIIKNNQLFATFTTNELSILQSEHTALPDFVISTDKDLYLARQFELLGIPVFNSTKSIEISDDKILTHQYLAKNKIPTPKTIVAPKVYKDVNAVGAKDMKHIVNALGYPFIIKEAFGSFGEQVYLIHNEQELQEKMKHIAGVPYFFQEFVQTSYGRDLRLQVVGDRVVAAMKRTAVDDFRANVTNGGTMQPHTPTEEEKTVAIQATHAIGADFAGVDLLYGKDENPLVCEVNSNAHIHNLYDCTGINSADFILEYILESLDKRSAVIENRLAHL